MANFIENSFLILISAYGYRKRLYLLDLAYHFMKLVVNICSEYLFIEFGSFVYFNHLYIMFKSVKSTSIRFGCVFMIFISSLVNYTFYMTNLTK